MREQILKEVWEGLYPVCDGETKSSLLFKIIDQNYFVKWVLEIYESRLRVEGDEVGNPRRVEELTRLVSDLDSTISNYRSARDESEMFPRLAIAADLRPLTSQYLENRNAWGDYLDFIQIYTYTLLEQVSFAREMNQQFRSKWPPPVVRLMSLLEVPLQLVRTGRIPLNAFYELCLNCSKEGAFVDPGVYEIVEKRIKEGALTIAMPYGARFPEVVEREGNGKVVLR